MKNRKPLNNDEQEYLSSLFDEMKNASNYCELDKYSEMTMKYLSSCLPPQFEELMQKECEIYHAKFEELHDDAIEGLKTSKSLKDEDEKEHHNMLFRIFKRRKH